MDEVAIVYRSKYGTTRQYAQWLAAELRCVAFDRRKIRAEDLEDFETIVYGGALYAGGVTGVKFLRKNIETLGTKNLVVFTCGLADPSDEKNMRNIRNRLIKTLTDEVVEHIKIFHVRGAINYKKLRLHHKFMMAMMQRSIAKKDPVARTEEDQQFLTTYGQTVDFKDKDSIRPIVEYVRELRNDARGPNLGL